MTQTFEELGNTLKGALEIIHAREAEIRKLDAELAEKDRRIAELEARIETGMALADTWATTINIGDFRHVRAMELRAALGEPVSKS